MNRKVLVTLLLVAAASLVLVGAFAGGGEGPTNVGTEKCAKMCHKVQLKSWKESKHATVEPVTDCEACHGPGSDYKKMSIMKDRAKAEAAGLIMPTLESCNEKCHAKAPVNEEQFAKVHAHKKK